MTDQLTGLVWLQQANCFGAGPWLNAIENAAQLSGDNSSLCGLTDGGQPCYWRIPNVKELLSILDFGQTFPDPLLTTGHPFIDVQVGGVDSLPSRYWSSTTVGSSTSSVYTVSIAVGWVERIAMGWLDAYMLPVRSGS